VRSSADKLNAVVVGNLKAFLAIFKGRGRRTNENKNAVDAVMTAVCGGGITSDKLARQLARQLEVSYRLVKRGEVTRSSMVDMDSKNWVRVNSKVPASAIRVEHQSIIAEALHGDDFSRVDNTDKDPIVINMGVDSSTGARLYDLHHRREMLYSTDAEILHELTGHNPTNPNNPNPPHPAWAAVVEATKTEKRPGGIKGSTKCRGTSRRRNAAGIAEGIVVGSDVVLRMHPDERRLNPEDEYFVGSVVEPAMKLDAPACYGTNSFYKNDWIVKIRWYELSSIEQNGDRMYKRGNMQFLNVKMVVQNLTRQIKLDHKGRGKYCLAKNLDDHIVQHGDINT